MMPQRVNMVGRQKHRVLKMLSNLRDQQLWTSHIYRDCYIEASCNHKSKVYNRYTPNTQTGIQMYHWQSSNHKRTNDKERDKKELQKQPK